MGVAVHVALDSDRLVEWQGEMVALQRFGVKVRLGTKRPNPPKGSHVWLRFGSLDQEFMRVKGMVWRVDSDGLIAVLVSLSDEEFLRLQGLSPPQQAKTLAARPDREPSPARSVPPKESMTAKERERALLALIHEGRKMVPTTTELTEKVSELTKQRDQEKSKRSKKKRADF